MCAKSVKRDGGAPVLGVVGLGAVPSETLKLRIISHISEFPIVDFGLKFKGGFKISNPRSAIGIVRRFLWSGVGITVVPTLFEKFSPERLPQFCGLNL
jgi:hypothetical protein